MTIRLRTARPDDHDAIVPLLDPRGSTRRLLADDLAGALPRHAVVAEVGRGAGLVAMGMTTRQPDEVHLLDVVVRPSHRRRGIASMVVSDLASRARDDGATAMTLEVRVSNGAGRALYRELGFTDQGIRPGYYRDGEDACILWHHDLAELSGAARPGDRSTVRAH